MAHYNSYEYNFENNRECVTIAPIFKLKGNWNHVRRGEGRKGPGDLGTRGPGDQGTRGPGDQGTRGPAGVEGTRGPGDQGSRGPGDQGSRELGTRGRGKLFSSYEIVTLLLFLLLAKLTNERVLNSTWTKSF